MLRALHLRGVGPAPALDVEFADRLNVLTGDNGLGKSFLLDVAWWGLTGTWPGLPAWPRPDARRAEIRWTIVGKTGREAEKASRFEFQREAWSWPSGRPNMPGLTVYARVDGSFSVWDPARNYWHQKKLVESTAARRPDAFHFTPDTLWEGLPPEGGKTHCNGLIRDWVSWQLQDSGRPDSPFALFRRALEVLSPSADEPLQPGEPTRISVEDVRDHPTLRVPYGTIPVAHASAGVKRILGLAYLVVWAWSEHVRASKMQRTPTDKRFVLLIDEVETHLHPRWQRRIVQTLLSLIQGLVARSSVQTVLTTHSPLVLASLEPLFDEERDMLSLLRLEQQRVHLEQVPWARQGDATDWLTSDVFGLRQARSLEAERAIEAAEAFMRGAREELPQGLATKGQIHAELRRVLPDQDVFWPRWIASRGP